MTGPRTRVIAVVDDDNRVLESMANLLESAGYCVRVFASAGALLEHCRFEELDCLISDISMPIMDGFELRRLAKATYPDLPVILITGRHETSEVQRPDNEHGDGFFEKPFNGQDLLAAIARLLSAARRSG